MGLKRTYPFSLYVPLSSSFNFKLPTFTTYMEANETISCGLNFDLSIQLSGWLSQFEILALELYNFKSNSLASRISATSAEKYLPVQQNQTQRKAIKKVRISVQIFSHWLHPPHLPSSSLLQQLPQHFTTRNVLILNLHLLRYRKAQINPIFYPPKTKTYFDPPKMAELSV